MTAYILRRLLHAALVVVLVSILVFTVMRLLPGDPMLMFLTRGDISTISPEQVTQLKHDLGLDKPLPLQYLDWATRVVQGDFGKSILFHYNVSDEILRRLPISLSLGISALLIGLFIGPTIGAICAIKRGSILDTVLTVGATIGITAPSFWVAIVLIYVFGLKLGVLPVYGYTSPLSNLGLGLQQSILPVVVLSVFPIAAAARQTRSSVLEVLNQDYVRTARAKGLGDTATLIRHVLKNALMPVATLQGEVFRNIVAGSIVVETVFVIPGMARLLVDGMLAQDFPVVQGVILIVALAVVLANLSVDMVYAWLDPRIQYA
jgi:peptide/nickel transport system permease protein